MQNYIVDPQIFYWIHVLAILQTVLGILGGILAAGAISLAIGWAYNDIEVKNGYESNAPYMEVFKKWTLISGFLSIIMIVAAVFIPGRSTSIEMLIARTVTYDNVDWTVQQMKEIVDYIVQALK